MCFAKQGSIRGRVQVGEHSLVRIRPTLRVSHQVQVYDRRTAWQVRTAPQDLLEGQVVGPEERQPVLKTRELVLELSTPEAAQRSRPDHREHLSGLGKQLQNVIDQFRKVVDGRDSGFVVPQGRVAQESLIDRRQQERRLGKDLRSMLARKRRRRTSHRHDEVGGGAVGERGADIVDESLFRCGDKPCRTDDELDDGNWSPRARLEIDAEVGGEGIKRKIAAVERLQYEDVRWRRLGFGWGRTEQQPGCHRRA